MCRLTIYIYPLMLHLLLACNVLLYEHRTHCCILKGPVQHSVQVKCGVLQILKECTITGHQDGETGHRSLSPTMAVTKPHTQASEMLCCSHFFL